MSAREPSAGQTYYTEDGEENEIVEVLSKNEDENVFTVVDEDGDEASIKWSESNERWEVAD